MTTDTLNEIEAMSSAYDVLSPLSRKAQMRALRWLKERLEWEATNPKYDKPDHAVQGQSDDYES